MEFFLISNKTLPLCIGIASAREAPLFSGFIAGVISGIVAGSTSDSAHVVSGQTEW